MTVEPSAFIPPFFAPEVIQTSAMDCGPAVLKCLLDGFGIPVSYGRLREACQTDVDGTSIDTLEEIAQQLGLDVQQTIVPRDHLVVSAADLLPALVVVLLPEGNTHFVVAWRLHGPWIQVMDPGSGRRWYRHQRFLSEVYWHTYPYPASLWRDWAGSDELIAPLEQRLGQLGLTLSQAEGLIDNALAEDGWRPVAALDAATRMTTSIVQTGHLGRGGAAHRVLTHLLTQALNESPDATPAIPEGFWAVRPAPQPDISPDVEQLRLQGAVLLRVWGRLEDPASGSPTGVDAHPTAPETTHLSPSLAAALAEPSPQPMQQLWQLIRSDGLLTPAAAALGVGFSAAGTVLQAPLLQGLMILAPELLREAGRLDWLFLILAFFFFFLCLDTFLFSTIFLTGRRLEARLRLAFLSKIPRLGDRYFHSRLTSDLAQRAYSLHQIRMLPGLGLRGASLVGQLLFTTMAIGWFAPAAAPIALLTLVLMLAVVLLAQPLITQADLRARTHDSALSRFHLDALQGLIPLRTHSAETALRREHEGVLREWVRASWQLTHWQVAAQTLALLIGFAGTVGIIFTYLASRGDPHEILLLLFWALQLPALAQLLLQIAQQYPGMRNIVLRLLEPLGAPEEEPALDGATPPPQAAAETRADGTTSGVAIDMDGVVVTAAGRTILDGIDLHIAAGEHVAVVGASGAGKSSLVGLLLGWHQPASGWLRVDGEPLSGAKVAAVRHMTAWLDPAVQLWNRSLEENLYYGVYGEPGLSLSAVLQRATLEQVVSTLPNALQSHLGEGGALVSGGEGQRVRLGRALMRPGVRLAILDEPFRGLDHRTRRELLNSARQHWRDATLICIMHDVIDTQGFARVVVVDEGRIVEDAPPEVLAAQPESLYRKLLTADEAVQTAHWQSAIWRRLRLEGGRLYED